MEHKRSLVLVALKDTWLKKSTIDSSKLPGADKLTVVAGQRCALVGGSTITAPNGYRLCVPLQ